MNWSKNENLLLLTDSYKVGHWPQYPPGTENVYSYFESRGGVYPSTVFFGLQYIMSKYLTQIELGDISEADALYKEHFGSDNLFNRAGWEKLYWRYGGLLPVRIKAVPEGTVVPTGNVLMTIENTDPEFPWLTNYLETILSQVWYPITVATTSYHVRQTILRYLEKTGDPSLIDFKLHDFGFRGASTVEAASLGGGAHLTSFMGTDTVPALTFLKRHYGAGMAGFSVPASEHSTMTAWGRDHEVDAYRNMIETYGNMPFYSVVSDSYDIFEAARSLWGETLREEVLNAEGTLVIRPDSGDPPATIEKLLNILGDKFGYTMNEKGYRVLNPKVRVIWGDGLDPRMIESILMRMQTWNWSADNIVFGMGGGLLQKVNRDTQKFAFKCSSVIVNGEERDVFKQPITDPGKNSKRGRLELVYDGGRYQTVNESKVGLLAPILQTVYEHGKVVKTYTLDEVRENTGMVVPVRT